MLFFKENSNCCFSWEEMDILHAGCCNISTKVIFTISFLCLNWFWGDSYWPLKSSVDQKTQPEYKTFFVLNIKNEMVNYNVFFSVQVAKTPVSLDIVWPLFDFVFKTKPSVNPQHRVFLLCAGSHSMHKSILLFLQAWHSPQ